ncbi:hypothetical protein TNCV_5019421 [Trichonephila clavipes]|nr:hypothetical protein TNCV_5019421 [Trichonephila clavipes]
MPSDRQYQIEPHEIHRDNGLAFTPVVSRSFEHIQVTVQFDLISLNFENTERWNGQGNPISPSLPPNSREDLRLDEYLVSPCRTRTIHSQTSMPSPGFKQKLYGTAVSVTNH